MGSNPKTVTVLNTDAFTSSSAENGFSRNPKQHEGGFIENNSFMLSSCCIFLMNLWMFFLEKNSFFATPLDRLLSKSLRLTVRADAFTHQLQLLSSSAKQFWHD